MRRLCTALALTLALAGASAPPAVADEPEVTAQGAVLWDPADDRVLWGKQPSKALAPASTTKIMTILVALEAGTIHDTVTVSAEAAEIGRRAGAATLGLEAGQTISMRTLLAGLIVRSGNDAAVAVAEHTAGSEAAFVDQMNARAAELGLTDTNFVNASGLTDDPDHHSSALDLARLAEVAMRHDDFAAWASSAVLELPALGVLENRNLLLERYEGATGVKTGYTALAGLCLVASARRDGRSLFAVVLNSDDTTADGSFDDAAEILDHGFTDFTRVEVAAPGSSVVAYQWSDASVTLTAAEPLARTVAADATTTWRVRLDPDADRPIRAGEGLGHAELLVGKRVVDTTPLYASTGVPEAGDHPVTTAAGFAVQDAVRSFARLYAGKRQT